MNGGQVDNRETIGPSEDEIRRAIPPAAGAHEFRVGVFVLLAIVGFVTVLYMMTDPSTFRGRYTIVTRVDNASGIRTNDPVQMKGVNIGRVRRFGIFNDTVDIALEIDGEWDIPVNSTTQLSSSGLLGGVVIEVLQGDAEDFVGDGDVLPGVSTMGLMDSFDSLGGQAENVMVRIQELLSNPTVTAVEGSANQLRVLLDELTTLTRTQGAEIARLTESLTATAGSLEEAGPDARATLAEARATMETLNGTSEALRSATASLDTILGRVAAGEGSLGRLSTDDELYSRLSDAAESARLLLDDIREHPDRYIKISVF